VHVPLTTLLRHIHRRLDSDRGQTTAEYGLVVLAAGTLALALILWARGSSITSLFDQVIDHLTSEVFG
jgi:Flp pilus assembly pilin Flp